MKSSFQRAREEEQAAYELAVKRASAGQVAELNQANREDMPATPAHAAAEASAEHNHNPQACGDEFEDGDEIGMRRVRRVPGDVGDQADADTTKGNRMAPELSRRGVRVSEPVTDGLTTKGLPVRPGPEARAAYGTPEPMTLDRAPRGQVRAPVSGDANISHGIPCDQFAGSIEPAVARVPRGPMDATRIT